MNRLSFSALLLTTSVFMPAAALGQASQDEITAETACGVLVQYLEIHEGYDFPVTLDEARQLQQAQDSAACREGIDRIDVAVRNNEVTMDGQPAGQPSADGTILVQQPAPIITVDQAAPKVTVSQPEPNVTVTQAQPEIIVRQPAPTVTIDIPQPEIIVRMPQPEVSVSQAEPTVDVALAEPTVRVTQPEQPDVQVQESQAQVLLGGTQQQANVTIEQAEQPNVVYEREEPQVVINQAEGQPTIQMEQAAAQPDGQTEQAQGQASTAPDAAGQAVLVSELMEADVFTTEGEQFGEVESVMIDTDGGETMLIISHGGLWDLGDKRIAIPLSEVALRDDQFIARNFNDDQIRQMPAWAETDRYREAPLDQTAEIDLFE